MCFGGDALLLGLADGQLAGAGGRVLLCAGEEGVVEEKWMRKKKEKS